MKLSFAYIQRPVLVYVLKMASLEIHTANQQRPLWKLSITQKSLKPLLSLDPPPLKKGGEDEKLAVYGFEFFN